MLTRLLLTVQGFLDAIVYGYTPVVRKELKKLFDKVPNFVSQSYLCTHSGHCCLSASPRTPSFVYLVQRPVVDLTLEISCYLLSRAKFYFFS